MPSIDSFHSRGEVAVGGRTLDVYRLDALTSGHVARLPFSLKVLLENLLRHEDGRTVTQEDIAALAAWDPKAPPDMRGAVPAGARAPAGLHGRAVRRRPRRDARRHQDARRRPAPHQSAPAVRPRDRPLGAGRRVRHRAPRSAINAELELERNRERYALLRWGQEAFDNFRVVPPDTGIVHQVNLEYLATVVFEKQADGATARVSGHARRHRLAHDDDQRPRRARLGRGRHRGRGGDARPADADAHCPRSSASSCTGALARGRDRDRPRAHGHADAAREGRRREVRRVLRQRASASLPLADRATIANMAPEYGATMGFFPVRRRDARVPALHRPRRTRSLQLVEAYTKEQGLFRTDDTPEPLFTDTLRLDLGEVEPSIAGPKRPQDRVRLSASKQTWRENLVSMLEQGANVDPQTVERWLAEGGSAAKPIREIAAPEPEQSPFERVPVTDNGNSYTLTHGSVVIAAITICTNTSNPPVMLAAGLLARKAVRARPAREAVGEDEPRARLEGRDRLPRRRGSDAVSRSSSASISSATAARRASATRGPLPEPVSERDPRRQPRRRVGALRQPQLRGPRPLRGARELPRVAAAGRRLRARRARWTSTCDNEPLGTGSDGAARVPARHLADAGAGSRRDAHVGEVGDVPRRSTRYVFEGDGRLAQSRRPDRRALRLGCRTRRTSSGRRTSTA